MLGKFMDFCYKQDRKSPGVGMMTFVFGMTFGILFVTVAVVSLGYKLSGAGERHQEQVSQCEQKGGKLIYVKGTGYVCMSGVIELETK